MGLFEELQPYTDSVGLCHSKPVDSSGLPPTGNGLFVTAVAFILGGVDSGPVWSLILAIHKCEVQPGLYRRHPLQADQEARDDYMALSACNSAFGDWIRHYGELHRYVFNNVVPGTIWKPWPWSTATRKWWLKVLDFLALSYPGISRPVFKSIPQVINEGAMLWHHIDFIPHLKFASMRHTEPPGWFGRLLWCLSLFNVARSDGLINNNAYLLAWLRIYAYKKFFFKYRLCDMAVRYFWKRMDKQGLTMKKVWVDYANDGGAHPFSRYWEDMR